ncbi:glycosyltransferase family 4 protein [Schlesneria paludicola]|uniref:glycosyltransferase family 4 protein n=1 Tax=Schlesneria paludicola TaxID=360056 RepID=UPI00029A700B|nr:glycosyltransferase family 4 protein [Schlesneria paludicola]
MAIGTPDFTGASRMAWVIARGMKSAGHRVIVVTGRRPPDGHASVIDALRAEGIETIEESGFERRVPDRGLIDRLSKLVQREGVQRLISETQQDLKVLVFVAKKTGIRLVYHAQNRVLFSNNWLIQIIKRYLYKQLLKKHVFKVICISDYLRLQHVQEYRIPESMVITVNNGIDVSRFQPIDQTMRESIRSSFGVLTNQLMFLNVGRLTFQKGQDLLLRSLANANLNGKNYKLVLIGAKSVGLAEDAEYEEKLHRLADAPELKGKCIFAGWRDDIPSLLLSADAYLHSANFEGGVPLAVLEGMTAGLPTVSTDCAGMLGGFVPGLHGYVGKTGDVASFQSEIEKLLALSEQQRLSMGHEAAKLIRERFDSNVTTRRFVEAATESV